MEIPIMNSLDNNLKFKNELNIKNLNNLNLSKVDKHKYPAVKILNELPKNNSLFETVIVSANDELVNLFLKNQIKFHNISKFLVKFIKMKEFSRFKKIKPLKVESIVKLNNYVRLKINSMSI